MSKSELPHPGVFVDRSRTYHRQLAPGVSTELSWGAHIMLSRVTLEPGGVVPEHSHPHEQSGICLEGRFELVVDGERRVIEAGEIYQIPGGVVHSARGLEARAVTLDIFSPVREDYLPPAE